MRWYYFSLAFFLAMLIVMLPSNDYLKSAKSSPLGVVSLELAFSHKKAKTIYKEWDTHCRIKGKLVVCDSPATQIPAPFAMRHNNNLRVQGIWNTILDLFFIL